MVNLGIGDRVLLFLLFSTVVCSLLPLKTTILWLVVFASAGFWLGVYSPKSNLLFGNTLQIFADMKAYDQTNLDKAATSQFGSFHFGKRELTTANLDLIRAILIKQFSSFKDRIFISQSESATTKDNFLRNMVGSLKGEEWKYVRNIITPAFNSSKLKKGTLSLRTALGQPVGFRSLFRATLEQIIPTLNQSVKRSFSFFDQHSLDGTEMDIEKMIGRIGMDIIGHVGFSIDVGAFEEPESPFIKNSKNVFGGTLTGWKPFAFNFFPFLTTMLETWLSIDLMDSTSHIFFRKFLNELYEKRKAESAEEKKEHNDTFQFLMDTVVVKEELTMDTNNNANSKKPLSKTKLMSQAFIIFVAGYDTTGLMTFITLYMLALHPEIQQRLRDEIDDVLEEEDEITYEHLHRLVYLNQVIQETLRIHPLVPRLNRVCTEDVTINGFKFNKGDYVNVPVYAVQHHPEFYPNPEVFDPDRFSPENKAGRDPLTFLTFGYGPRSCIGIRLAEMQMRVVVALLIKNYRFERAQNSMSLPLKTSCADFLRLSETVYVNVHKR